jgi:hypothetical protein
MAQDLEDFALAFWRRKSGQNKSPYQRIGGAFESLTSALAVIFFNSSRIFKGITTT